MSIIKPTASSGKTPAQIKLEALLAKARAQQAASSTEQIKAMLGEVQAKGVHDIDLSNITSKKATEAENAEALDAVVSALPSSSSSSNGPAICERSELAGQVAMPAVSQVAVSEPAVAASSSKQLGVMREISLNEQQRKAADLILSGASCVLIGKAGTGKTTMMRTAMQELIASKRIPMLASGTKQLQSGLPGVAVVSYTNKAVNNIRHAMPGEVKPHTLTLHKLLEFEPVYYELPDEATGQVKKTMRFEPARNQYNPLPEGLQFIAFEESSMIGTGLHQLLLDALSHEVQFLYIGDIRQLPPVFDQAILGYKMLELPVVELTEVYRQALESPILRCALTLDEGKIEEFRPGKATKDPKTKKFVWPGLAKWNERGEHGSLTFQPWQREVSPLEALGNLRLFFKTQYEAGLYNPEEDIILCPMQKEANDLGQKLLSCFNLNAVIADFLSRERGALVHEVIAGFNKHYLAEGDRVLYQKEDALITKIVRNGRYLGKKPKAPAVNMDRYGIMDEDTVGYEKPVEDPLGATKPVNYDPILGDLNSFGEEDAEAMLNSLGSVTNDRVNQASHLVTVFCPVTDVTVELTTAAEINDLLGGYALTVHKAQGSEWEKVYLVIHHTHRIALSRELVYTAFTRARKHLHVFIHPEGMAAACRNQRIKGNTIAEKAEFFKGKRDKNTIALEDAAKREKEAAAIAARKAAVQAKLDECLDLAKKLWPDNRHDLLIKLLYLDCGNAAGVAHFGDGKNCIIKISPTYLQHDMDDALHDTIPHEVAHLLANRWFGCKDHSKEWKDIAVALGSSGEQFHLMPAAHAIRSGSIAKGA